MIPEAQRGCSTVVSAARAAKRACVADARARRRARAALLTLAQRTARCAPRIAPYAGCAASRSVTAVMMAAAAIAAAAAAC
jgi:hypothetical protein